MSEKEFYGFDELRDWLQDQGFKIYYNHLNEQLNQCNWYACRKTQLKARECETNENKMQILIRPFKYTYNLSYGSSEIEIVGEANSIWFNLKAYSVQEEDIYTRLDVIEQMLVSAWNGLITNEHS